MTDWSHDHSLRVFALQPVEAGAVEALVSLAAEQPKWPLWMPEKLKFPDEQDRAWIDQLDSLVIRNRKPPSLVLAWDNKTHTPVTAARITAVNAPQVLDILEADVEFPPFDWLEYLGLTR